MLRWLVTGASGMLGRDLVIALERCGEEVTGLARTDLDVSDENAVSAELRRHRPSVVVNCAAWTGVNDAEAHEEEAFRVNGHGAACVASACADIGAHLVHMSTDYVFSGESRHPYAEHEAAQPRTAYGRTKLAGELAVLQRLPNTGYVVRTAWLYGEHGPNFVRTMLRLERELRNIDVVDDQQGQPTWAGDAANQIIALVRSGAAAGIYHATSSGKATWFEFAQEIFRLSGADPARILPTTRAAYSRGAGGANCGPRRPRYSVLGHGAWAAAGIQPIMNWRRALSRALPLIAATA